MRQCVEWLKSDVNDFELNGETDDEDMEDGETGFDDGSAQVRDVRDPGQPTESERREHMSTHRPNGSWCKFCVMGRGVNSPHRRSDAQDDVEGVRHVSTDYGFLVDRESEEQVTPVEKRNRISTDCEERSEVWSAWAQQSYTQM